MSLLKRDGLVSVKTNKVMASLVPIMTANILLNIYQDTDDWPESFVKVKLYRHLEWYCTTIIL